MNETHMTFSELCSEFCNYNKTKKADAKGMVGVIVFASSNWPDKDYSLENRSYAVSSDNKYFMSWMGGNSLYGGNLDRTDNCVRLDWYLGSWKIDYCYIRR